LQQVKEVKQESEYLLKLKELTWVEKLNQAEASAASEITKLKGVVKVIWCSQPYVPTIAVIVDVGFIFFQVPFVEKKTIPFS
jgi:hypothetical protein